MSISVNRSITSQLFRSLWICFLLSFTVIKCDNYYDYYEVCADGTFCDNGSTCIELDEPVVLSNKKIKYYKCDCEKAMAGTTKVYAGWSCQYEASTFCAWNNPDLVTVTFCTNGDCSEIFSSHDKNIEHEPCICDSGYAGDYCEYVVGEEPMYTYSGKNNSLWAGRITVIVVCVIVVLILALSARIGSQRQHLYGGNVNYQNNDMGDDDI